MPQLGGCGEEKEEEECCFLRGEQQEAARMFAQYIHSFTSQQLGRPGVGITRTQVPAQGKGGVEAKPGPEPGFSRAK